MESSVKKMAQKASGSSVGMRSLTSEQKNEALFAIADAIEANKEEIIEANKTDLENAKKTNLAIPLLKRLEFSEVKMSAAVRGIKDMADLPDPVGKTTYHCTLDDDLELYRVTSPLGVIGVIFESRPDALVQISCLCLKSSNAVLLKGGSEATLTNSTLTKTISDAARDKGIPDGWISLLKTRSDVRELLEQEQYVDLIIPRGSNRFVREIMENTSIPVLGHADGVCHTFIDKDACIKDAVKISLDAKTQYPAACNATETILIHSEIADMALKALMPALEKAGVKVFGCEKTAELTGCEITQDWHKEYLDLMVSIRIVESFAEAVSHINEYGSGHTDAIVTDNEGTARKFMSAVDSGNVFWNCSTRFSDGFRYGFGAEVGISTSKIHARGPVGLEGLVTYKYKLFGKDNAVSDYSSGDRTFKHLRDDDECPFDR